MSKFRLPLAAAAVSASLLAGLSIAAPATAAQPAAVVSAAPSSASVAPTTFGVITQRKVVNKSRIATNYVNTSQALTSCTALSANLSCSIGTTRSATRSIDLTLGISRSAVAGSLGISSSISSSVQISCNSGPLKAGQRMVAYPTGSRWQYKVNKIDARSGVVLSNTTSGWQYAFNPSGVACRVS